MIIIVSDAIQNSTLFVGRWNIRITNKAVIQQLFTPNM
jgi:hypothetical protein